jgi:two-component system nitrogen regulation response regulator GlnG
MQEVYKRIGLVAESESSVLILGETGTGKELVARAIHDHSPRRAGPFVAVNCGAIPESLAESELFGHEKGAFTGADSDRRGRFEAADNGTLFLDEVGELSAAAQVKLLRVLDTRTIERVGAVTPIRLDVRILAATNRPLDDDVASGRFREDLYYRLNVIHIELPPLRERGEDIADLARCFLQESGHTGGLEDDALRALHGYHWPGNVRELKNAMEHAAVVSAGRKIVPGHLPESITSPAGAGEDVEEKIKDYFRSVLDSGDGLYQTVIEPIERAAIQEALRRCEGNRKEAAELLGMHRNTLRKKMKDLGINP